MSILPLSCCCANAPCQICCKPPSSITTQMGQLSYVKSGFQGGGDAQHNSILFPQNRQSHWYGTATTTGYLPVDIAYPYAIIQYNCDDKYATVKRTVMVGQYMQLKDVTTSQVTYPVKGKNCSNGFIPSYFDERISWVKGTTVIQQTLCCQPPQQVTVGQTTYTYTAYATTDNGTQFYYGTMSQDAYPASLLWVCDTSVHLYYNIIQDDTIGRIYNICKNGAFSNYLHMSDDTNAAQISWLIGDVQADDENNFCCKTCAIPYEQVNGLPFYATWYQVGAGPDLQGARQRYGTILYAYNQGNNWAILRKRCNLGIFQPFDILQAYTVNTNFSYANRVGGGDYCLVFGMYTNLLSGSCDGSQLYQGLILNDTNGQSSIVTGSYKKSQVRHLNTQSGYFATYIDADFSCIQADNQLFLDQQFYNHCGE